MNVIKLRGEDQRLYRFVGHLVMDEDVLCYNLNYPYKTSPEYYWFIATEHEETLGFIPVKIEAQKAVINNYYIKEDNCIVFSALLQEIVRTLRPDYQIESVTQIRHIPYFEQIGFSTVLRWKRYVKMKIFNHEEKCI